MSVGPHGRSLAHAGPILFASNIFIKDIMFFALGGPGHANLSRKGETAMAEAHIYLGQGLTAIDGSRFSREKGWTLIAGAHIWGETARLGWLGRVLLEKKGWNGMAGACISREWRD